MQLCLSPECRVELEYLTDLDSNVGEALRACIDMLQRDPNEFEGIDGFSVKRIGGLFRRGIRIYRVKYERYIPGLRIFFFSIPSRNCVFITGIHERETLGAGMDYDFARDAFARAQRYWALRGVPI
jgi:hypothetical protein